MYRVQCNSHLIKNLIRSKVLCDVCLCCIYFLYKKKYKYVLHTKNIVTKMIKMMKRLVPLHAYSYTTCKAHTYTDERQVYNLKRIEMTFIFFIIIRMLYLVYIHVVYTSFIQKFYKIFAFRVIFFRF